MQKNTRVLVVDDDRSTRALLRAFLKTSGFEVAEAEDSERAVEQIHAFEPQVILLDILMPGIAGNELVETIKDWKPEIGVIMVTSVDNEAVKEECLKKGAFEVLIKPVTQASLKDTIERALQAQS